MPATHPDPAEANEFIIAPRWLIPVEPAATVLTDYVVVIRNGRILAIADRAGAKLHYIESGYGIVSRAAWRIVLGYIQATCSIEAHVGRVVPSSDATLDRHTAISHRFLD